jgi:hypothetical protein
MNNKIFSSLIYGVNQLLIFYEHNFQTFNN